MTEAVTRPARTRGHVYEADVVRVLTFACVIAVHTIANTEPAHSVPANGFEMLLHFTREAFFALTGFVLMYQTLGRPQPQRARTFWRRRLVAVGVPYLAWSVIYTGIQAIDHHGGWAWELGHLASNIAYGTAWYHLYFLLVSMQIYLLFPLIERLIRATAAHHGVLLAVSATIELATLTAQMYYPPKTGWLVQVATHQDALIISYQFYVLMGAVAAFHLDRLRDLVAHHPRTLTSAIIATAVAAEVWYLVAANNGAAPAHAAAVLQPVMLVWSAAAIAGLFMLGESYAQRRQRGSSTDRALTVASDRSFGVFLVHPLILWLLLKGQSHWFPGLRGAPLTVLAYIAVVAGSLAATELFRRSALSLPLTGRRILRPASIGKEIPVGNTAAYRKETDHARDDIDAPRPRHETARLGHDDGDRHRATDSLLL